jgi:hypothetical protein
LPKIEPFELSFSSADWEDLRHRIKQIRWPDEISNSDWRDALAITQKRPKVITSKPAIENDLRP